MSDSESKTPTHMGAAHAISKIEQKFQNRIPREFDKVSDILRKSMIYIRTGFSWKTGIFV